MRFPSTKVRQFQDSLFRSSICWLRLRCRAWCILTTLLTHSTQLEARRTPSAPHGHGGMAPATSLPAATAPLPPATPPPAGGRPFRSLPASFSPAGALPQLHQRCPTRAVRLRTGQFLLHAIDKGQDTLVQQLPAHLGPGRPRQFLDRAGQFCFCPAPLVGLTIGAEHPKAFTAHSQAFS